MNSFCPWEPATYLVFSSNVPSTLYYALFPGMIASLVVSFFLLAHGGKKIAVQNLVAMSLLFLIWGYFNLIQFSTNRPDVVYFFWALMVIVEPLIYFFAVLFSYEFLYNSKLNFNKTILLILPLLPISFLLSTKLNLVGINLSDCTAIEGVIAKYYSYSLEAVYALIILLLIIFSYRRAKKNNEKKILYFGIGIILFLFTFSSGNIFGSFTDDWVTSQYGYFGMPIFLGFLVYIIVKHHAFNVKLIATQALVWGMTIMIGSQYFFIKVPVNFVLNTVTFVAMIIFGRFLIKSVKVEIEQKERLQKLTTELADANERLKGLDKLKSEFISLASHQLRSPLTVIKGYASTLTDGIVGDLTDKQKEVVQHIYISAQGLASVVEDFLNVTKIEQGGMKYVFEPTDIRQIVNDLASDMRIPAVAKKLDFQTDIHTDGAFMVNADGTKMKQVFLNLIDNSIKYTKEGFVKVWLNSSTDEKGNNTMTFGVSDSGVGVSDETRAKLFQKFGRGEGAVMNGGGSGLGLYLAQEIVKAHGGEIKVDSEGLGKGSTFSVTLPLLK